MWAKSISFNYFSDKPKSKSNYTVLLLLQCGARRWSYCSCWGSWAGACRAAVTRAACRTTVTTPFSDTPTRPSTPRHGPSQSPTTASPSSRSSGSSASRAGSATSSSRWIILLKRKYLEISKIIEKKISKIFENIKNIWNYQKYLKIKIYLKSSKIYF